MEGWAGLGGGRHSREHGAQHGADVAEGGAAHQLAQARLRQARRPLLRAVARLRLRLHARYCFVLFCALETKILTLNLFPDVLIEPSFVALSYPK